MRQVKTICPYCGVGCGIILHTENGKIVGLTPDRDHPISKGTLCSDGLEYGHGHGRDVQRDP